MFKGTLRQRKRPARIAAIDERMQTMQRRIEIWKKVRFSLSLRLPFFPSLPRFSVHYVVELAHR
jgi:hypothetical protein